MRNTGSRARRFLALLATALAIITLALTLGPDRGTQAVGPAGPNRVVVPAVANGGSGPPESAAEAAARLAQSLVHPPSLLEGVHAVEEALSRAGVASGTFDQILVPARYPVTPEVDLPVGVLNLALEANGGTLFRMTAAELGAMFADFGWPFATSSSSGEQVVAMLAALVQGAREAPNDPASFGPLLLGELTQLKDPPFDLTVDGLAPEDVRLSLLDLKLITSLFDRVSIKSVAPASAAVFAAANEPCTDAKKWISGATGPFGGQIYGLSTSQTGPGLVDKGLEAAGVSKANTAAAGAALGVVSIAAKLWKLLEFYSNAKISVTPDDASKITHKWLDTEALQLRLFKGTVGVSEEDWKEYVDSFSNISQETNKSIRDCLNEFGLSVPADLGDIIKDAENWKVDWYVKSGKNSRGVPNAWWTDTSQPDRGTVHGLKAAWQTSPTKVSDYSAATSFVVDIGTELETDHPSPQKLDNVDVCGDVIAASPPSLSTFFGATTGIIGLVDAITELAAGWLQTVAPPSSCAVIGVTWHESCPGLSAQSQAALQVAAAAAGDPEPLPCEWTGTMNGTVSETTANGFYSQDWQGRGTVKFRLKSVSNCPGCSPPSTTYNYELVEGSAAWQSSGHWGGSCTYDRSGTDPLAYTSFRFTWNGAGPWEYSGGAIVAMADRSACSGPNNAAPIWNELWLYCYPEIETYSGSGSITGSCTRTRTNLLGDSTTESYNWQFTGGACLPKPETPVCGP